jgi:hypothetical protein
METAKRRKTGTQCFYISAMLMAYLTYESYINFLGDRFAPEIWAKEREFFSQKVYRGLPGKLKYLAERIPIKGIKTNQRPMQTIRRLKKLRDFLSHGIVDKYEKTITHHRDKEPPLFGPYGRIDKLVAPELAARAVLDVREFIEFLHSQAREHAEHIWLGEDPWDAFRAHAWSESRTKA